MPTYLVWIEGIGDVHKVNDCIGDARDWARIGFPDRRTSVARPVKYCGRCQCAPCDCPRRPRVEVKTEMTSKGGE